MNEIEETLLMLFLEKRNLLDLYCRLYDVNHPLTASELDELDNIADDWLTFKQEELGRTIPEEFEFFISRSSYQRMCEDKIVCASLDREKDYYSTIKIKITVVEND